MWLLTKKRDPLSINDRLHKPLTEFADQVAIICAELVERAEEFPPGQLENIIVSMRKLNISVVEFVDALKKAERHLKS